MKDSYILKNVGSGVVSFDVMVAEGDLENLPRHKRRKATRGSIVKINISAGMTVDLVEVLGVPSEVAATLPEVVDIMKKPVIRALTELIEVADIVKVQEAAKAKAQQDALDAEADAEFERQQKAQQDALDAEAEIKAAAEAEEAAAEVEAEEAEEADTKAEVTTTKRKHVKVRNSGGDRAGKDTVSLVY